MSQPIRTYTEPIKLEQSNMVIRVENGGWEIEVGGTEQPRWFATGDSLEDVIASLVRAVTEDAIADEARAWEEAAGGETVDSEPRHSPSAKLTDAGEKL